MWWPTSRLVTTAIARRPRTSPAACGRARTSYAPRWSRCATRRQPTRRLSTCSEQACAEGRTSLFNSGVDPGWANDVIALTMTGFSSRVDSITMLEILDYGPINQPDIMFDFMGFAHPPDHPAPLFDTERLAAFGLPPFI